MVFRAFTTFFFTVQVVAGQIVDYEGNSLPEDSPIPWIPNAVCDPERWVSDGRFFQHVEQCPGFPPPAGQRASYTRSLDEFVGVTPFFIEWQMWTDGDRSEIPGTAPASMVLGSFGSVNYHFTVARDQVLFLRDNFLPLVWVDIAPDTSHTFRLELHGEGLYVWCIDGDIVDSGVPEGAYPSFTPIVQWRGKSWFLESTTQWDYIRYGRIPEDGGGDFNSDGMTDAEDFYFFQECRSNSGPDSDAGPGCRWADMDQDADVDAHDFALFQRAFAGAG